MSDPRSHEARSAAEAAARRSAGVTTTRSGTVPSDFPTVVATYTPGIGTHGGGAAQLLSPSNAAQVAAGSSASAMAGLDSPEVGVRAQNRRQPLGDQAPHASGAGSHFQFSYGSSASESASSPMHHGARPAQTAGLQPAGPTAARTIIVEGTAASGGTQAGTAESALPDLHQRQPPQSPRSVTTALLSDSAATAQATRGAGRGQNLLEERRRPGGGHGRGGHGGGVHGGNGDITR